MSLPDWLGELDTWLVQKAFVKRPLTDRDVATGALIQASKVNSLVGCSATLSAAVSITTSGTWQTINWDTEDWDTNAYHDLTTNKNRITIPTGASGKYLIKVGANFAANATGVRAVQVNKNTTTANTNVIAQASQQAFSGVSNDFQASRIVALADGDWISVNAFQTSGGALNFASTPTNAFFLVQRIG